MIALNKNYTIDGNIDTNICLISDIHYHSKSDIKYLNKVLNKIKLLNPSYICIPGDLIDECNIKDEEVLINWLTRLGMVAKTIISIGNHEYYISKKNCIYGFNDELFNKIRKIKDIYVLDNESIRFNNINFIGLTLEDDYYYKYMEKDPKFIDYISNVKVDNNCYNVLLCHSPSNMLDKNIINRLGVDLVLCGHTHGGMTPKILRKFIKHGGIIDPNKKFFPKNVYGNIKINNTNIIITSGITVVSHMNKFRILKNFFSGEIVNINIKKH